MLDSTNPTLPLNSTIVSLQLKRDIQEPLGTPSSYQLNASSLRWQLICVSYICDLYIYIYMCPKTEALPYKALI